MYPTIQEKFPTQAEIADIPDDELTAGRLPFVAAILLDIKYGRDWQSKIGYTKYYNGFAFTGGDDEPKT